MLEEWKQQQSGSSSQLTPTTKDLGLVHSTQSTVRRQLVDIAESKLVDLEQLTDSYELELADLQRSSEAYKSESVDLQKPIDMYEPEPTKESTGTSEPEPTIGGRRYLLRKRRAPTTYASQYILFTNEGEPECYDEAIADEHKEKWQSAMQDEMDSLHENYTYDLVELPKV